jgi:hypothetical protein
MKRNSLYRTVLKWEGKSQTMEYGCIAIRLCMNQMGITGHFPYDFTDIILTGDSNGGPFTDGHGEVLGKSAHVLSTVDRNSNPTVYGAFAGPTSTAC